MQKADQKYFQRDAEPEARVPLPDATFGHALVIPAYGEGENLLRVVESVPGGPAGPVLSIVVVNARADAPDEMHTANAALLKRLRDTHPLTETLSTAPPMTLHHHPRGALLLIDRSVDPWFLPAGQGVGLARKIGTDVAWAFHLAGKLRSPWLHGTDADVMLPPDYFAQTAEVERTDVAGSPAALLHPFHHVCADEPDLADAMRMYDIYLHYYVRSLAWAGSPYAFHTIGSTITVAAEAYARVRGYPRRSAGEDFYFLNKLAKLGPVVALRGQPLRIDGRVSARVPFGTGRALGVIRHSLHLQGEAAGYRLYHPAIFRALRSWLRVLAGASPRSQVERAEPGRHPVAAEDHSPVSLLQSLVEASAGEDGVDPAPLLTVLGEMGALEAAAAAMAAGRDVHEWFDAFRTLRFVHELRNRYYPSPPLREALVLAEHLPGIAPLADGDLESIRREMGST